MSILDYFLEPYKTYSDLQIGLEFLGAFFGIWSVYCSAKKNIWVYPTGIISTAIYVYILFSFGLLGDMLINVYYTVMSIYGWVVWSKSAEDHIHVEVSKASPRDWKICTILFLCSILFVGLIYYFKPYFDNNFSMRNIQLGFWHLDWANYLDIFTTAIFLAGMWLMAEKKIENWLFWIVGDLICVPMMLYKNLGITAIQYLIFTIMAIYGYNKWRKANTVIPEKSEA